MRIQKKIQKFLSMLCCIIMLPIINCDLADASSPGISSSKYIRTYAISQGNDTPAYTNKECTNREGTIYANDEVYIMEIGQSGGVSYAYCSYPLDSGGRKKRYVKLSSFTPNNASGVNTARGKVYVYRRSNLSQQFGYTETGDTVWTIGKSGSSIQIIYTVGSLYKMGWVSASGYSSYIDGNGVNTNNENNGGQSSSAQIESALQWAVNIANDNSHGYSQTSRWGPDYDCSSLVITALKNAGFNTGTATYTGNMRSQLTGNGFTWIPWSTLGGSANLQKGDILLNEKSHTAFYLGNNQVVEAHGRSVADKAYDGRNVSVAGTLTGDQDGQEIRVTSYYLYSSGWDGVLRMTKKEKVSHPGGCIDEAVGQAGNILIRGWAFDGDYPSDTLSIHVYVGGPAGQGTFLGATSANVERKDVNDVYGCGNNHGYHANIQTKLTGTHKIYLYAVNQNYNTNCLLGERTVTISNVAPTATPFVKATNIVINQKNGFLGKIGESVQLKAEVVPSNATNKNVTWASQDSSVAVVDQTGKVTAKKIGITTIIAKSQDGKVKDTCIIKVNTLGLFFGDITGDKVISVTDLSELSQICVGKKTATSKEKEIADLNGDGIVNDTDVELLRQFIVGIITTFPVEQQLSKIVISTMPNKTAYYVGDTISTDGMKITAYYNNGTSKIIKNFNINGNTKIVGKQTVTISYKEAGITKSTSYSIEVKAIATSTIKPTVKPTSKPTLKPTVKPTSKPTLKPTVKPTVKLTIKPSATPTLKPTIKPSATSTIKPTSTIRPSIIPVMTPTSTTKPTAIPTLPPISTPLTLPIPTLIPEITKNEQLEKCEERLEGAEEDNELELQKGDIFDANGAIYEVTSASKLTVEFAALEKSSTNTCIIPATVKYDGTIYKVTGVAKNALKNNKKLTTVTIGDNVTYIGAYAFYGDSKLKVIKMKSKKITTMQKKAFSGLSKKTTIKVPSSVKNKYKKMLKKAGWRA